MMKRLMSLTCCILGLVPGMGIAGTLNSGESAVFWTDEISSLRSEMQPRGRAAHRDEIVGVSVREQITYSADRSLLTGARIEAVARAALGGWLSQRTARFKLGVISFPPDVLIPSSQFVISARPISSDLSLAADGPMTVWVDVMDGERRLHSSVVRYRIDALGSRVRVARTGTFEHALPAERFDGLKENPVSASVFAPQPYVVTPRDRALEVGRTPSSAPAHWSGPADGILEVVRGRVVQLDLKAGGVTVGRTGLALTDGRLGQSVRVQLPGGAAPLIGRVTGKGRLEIQL